MRPPGCQISRSEIWHPAAHNSRPGPGTGDGDGDYTLGNLNFAINTGEVFREKIQFPFFMQYPAAIAYQLPDVYHAFRKGHRVMVHVQSSWFPLIDRNPQVFMEIPTAKPSDFQKATQRVYRSAAAASGITVMVEK